MIEYAIITADGGLLDYGTCDNDYILSWAMLTDGAYCITAYCNPDCVTGK